MHWSWVYKCSMKMWSYDYEACKKASENNYNLTIHLSIPYYLLYKVAKNVSSIRFIPLLGNA